MGVNEKKYFASAGEDMGRLDSDSAAFAVPINSWVNAQNVRIGSTDKGVTGVVESIGGTVAISNKSLLHLNIGNVTDIPGKRIISFYTHLLTPSLDKIEVYSFTDDTVYTALTGAQVTGGLNFSRNYVIHSAEVIGNILYWTDDNNEPKRINIDSAIKMNNPSYVTNEDAYVSPLEVGVDYIIRMPPFCSPSVLKVTQPSIVVNNIAEFAGQFAYRYIFKDGEISVLSPISEFIPYNNPSDTDNTVVVVATDTTGTAVHINQDVQQVDFCVRYGNSGNFYVIKSWNKNIASQAAEIATHNSGGAALSYYFYNDKVGIALDAAYSVKPYDFVPLKSRALTASLSRILLGYNLESYNSPTLSSLRYTLDTSTANVLTTAFKSGCDYKMGIIFRDRFKRVIGNVFTNDSLRIRIPDRDYAYSTYVRTITWNITSGATAALEIPAEAYYYEIVITKNLRTRFFIESKASSMKYAFKNATTGDITYQNGYSPSAFAIAVESTSLSTDGIGYQFDAGSGDIMNIYMDGASSVYKLQVVGQDKGYILVKLDNLGNFISHPEPIFEIYTPYKESAAEPFYTVGKTFTVLNPGESNRDYGTTGVQITGDVTLGFAYGGINMSIYRRQSMSPVTKYWKDWFGNWGEVNIDLISKQVRKRTAVRWSNVLVEGTKSNGLSSFDALDEKILPLDLGALQKLQQTSKVQEQGNIVLAIGEGDTASLYMGEVQVVGADRNAFLSSAPNVIGTVNILKGNFGTINPESVTEYRGNVYWFDANNGRYVQYSANGLFPISNFKMTRFWKNWSEQYLSMTVAEIEALGGRPFVFSIVDPFHDELLISIPKLSNTPPKGYLPDYPSTIYPFDILDFQGKTIVYDIKESRWMGSYSFYAEGFATLQNQLYSYTSRMWLHNQYNNQCFFYETQYQPKVMCVSNIEPTKPKVYQNITIEGNMCPTFVYFYNDYPIQQSSDLVDFSFRPIEGNFVANVLRNKLVPTATGYTTDGLLTKEVMRNVAMFINVEFTVSGSNVMQLKFLNIGVKPSVGNTTV